MNDVTVTKLIHDLSYTAHGGSGYSHSYSDILEMDVFEGFRLIDHLNESREKEAAAIKKANDRAGR